MSESNILVVAEHDNKSLNASTLSTLTAAAQFKTHLENSKVDVLVIGSDCGAIAEQLTLCDSVDRVLVADHSVYKERLSENLSDVVVQCSNGYSHILASATTGGKDLVPRVAAQLDVGMLSDIVKVESADTIMRPIYAGNALAKVQSHDSVKVATVRTTAFEKMSSENSNRAEIEHLQIELASEHTQLVSRDSIQCERPELSSAEVVVSGGRGVGSKENFSMVEALADKLGGAIGASRAAVDAGFVTNDLQVGQTGKIVAPKLYIAIGISGAIQHLAGMKDSKVIVAINSDPDAPIFEIADYGLVGDLFTLLPELIDKIDG